jgi:predicted metal-dependent hydrolase
MSLNHSKSACDVQKKIELRAINEQWTLHFVQKKTKKIQILEQEAQKLSIIADHETMGRRKSVEKWLKQYSIQYLFPWIDQISKETGLHYQNVTIRGQRTRWGSCSEQHAISLNYKLLFLPQRLVDHLLLHELCHTVHLDHSKHFWQLLASYDKNWYEKRLHCQKAHHYIPSWLDQ